MNNKTFRLEDLDDSFWSHVVLIDIWPSTGLGGPGSLWIITNEAKIYFISFETLPFSEDELERLTPILKLKETIEDYSHPYEIEGNGWKYLNRERTLIRDDFYERFMNAYNLKFNHLKREGLVALHIPEIAGYALGVKGELERVNEERLYLLLKERNKNEEK